MKDDKLNITAYDTLAEYRRKQAGTPQPTNSHAWRGTWERPMKIDESTQHPFTVARMTDHNVRGRD